MASKTLKKKLVQKAEENTRVTKGTSKEQNVLKEGVPNEHSRKHLDNDKTTVGVSVGITKNMDNYESLRVDTWITDTVKDNETVEEAYDRVLGIVDNVLNNTVSYYTAD